MKYSDLYTENQNQFYVSKNIDMSELELTEDSYSIDVKMILKYANIELFEEYLFYQSGYLDENNTIHIDKSESDVRQRFTIAHELGHFLLDHGPSSRYKTLNQYNFEEIRKEQAANQFAADLLLPKKLIEIVKGKVRDQYQDMTDTEKLKREMLYNMAKLLRVSQISLEYRLKNLNMEIL